MSGHLHTLILAAGTSTRLGRPKQLESIDGQPALRHVLDAATSASSGEAVTVVLGAHAGDIVPLLQNSSAAIVINRGWQEGIAASLRCGVKALGPGVDAVMVVLGDQYALTATDLKRLSEAWQRQENLIAASSYKSQLGVPAIFPRWCFGELLELRGDQGAKRLLQRHAGRVISVPLPNAALDLDTSEDVERATQPT